MTPHHKLVSYCIIGIVIFAASIVIFVVRRDAPGWARASFLGLGMLALSYGVLGWTLEHYRTSLAYPARASLDHYRALVAGVAIGVLVVLAISGQFKRSVKRRNGA
jgi:hypothetical protein